MIQSHVQAKITYEQRSSKVQTPCWIWNGPLDAKGYGMTHLTQEDGGESVKAIRVHRYVYGEMVGEIMAGLQCHHVCEITCCCNPAHIVLVTQEEHPSGRQGEYNKAKAACPEGHLFTYENTMWEPSARALCGFVRVCRRCKVDSRQRWVENNRETAREAYKRANSKRREDPNYRAYMKEYQRVRYQKQQAEKRGEVYVQSEESIALLKSLLNGPVERKVKTPPRPLDSTPDPA